MVRVTKFQGDELVLITVLYNYDLVFTVINISSNGDNNITRTGVSQNRSKYFKYMLTLYRKIVNI